MKKKYYLLAFAALFSILFFSCKKDKDAPPDMGYNYFPTQQGKYVVYDVDSTFYNSDSINSNTHLAPATTYRFQIKEKVQSIFYDNQNRPTVRLERYIKYHNDTIPYSLIDWTLRDVWVENRTATTAEKVEENVRYIKLAFPVRSNQTWNGNAQNTLDEWDYSYGYFDKQEVIGAATFDSAMQVTQFDDGGNIAIQRKLYIEKYARNVGMVYKQVIDVGSQPPVGWYSLLYGTDSLTNFYNIPILQRVNSGMQYTMTVNSYGSEFP